MNDDWVAYGQALEQARHWRTQLQTTHQSLRSQARSAAAAIAKAEARIGRIDRAPAAPEPPGSTEEALEALLAHLADLERFDDVVALRERLAEWTARTPSGRALREWQAATRPTLAESGVSLASATPDAIDAARGALELREAALEAARQGIVAEMRDARRAASVVSEGSLEARDLVRGDAARMADDLLAYVASAREIDRAALPAIALSVGLGGGIGAAIVSSVGLPAGWMIGVMSGMFGGSVIGLALWLWRSRLIARGLATLAQSVAELQGDVRQAQAEVVADLARIGQDCRALSTEARDLEVEADLPNIVELTRQAEELTDSTGLERLAAEIAKTRGSTSRLHVAVAAGACLMGVASGAVGATLGTPEPAAPSLVVAEVPASPPAASPEVAPPPPPGPDVVTHAPFSSGRWAGDYGVGSVSGTLFEKDGKLRGSLALTEGAQSQECLASGTLSGSGRFSLKLSGCAGAGVVTGKVTANGAVLSGTGTRKLPEGQVTDTLSLRFQE